jgi:hypothetical protein
MQSYLPPKEVTKIALRLRHLIEQCVPCELEEVAVTRAHSRIITQGVIQAAREAGGDGEAREPYRSCVVFCLLVVKRWFSHQAVVELWDADLHRVRAIACEVIAKNIIETEEDLAYLLHDVLLRRYSILVDGEPTPPSNVIEKAVDLHALRVICSSGYQKCINYLWRGWLVQDENDPAVFVDYHDRDNRSLLVHLDPDRMRTPMYQNMATLLMSFVYLGLYTSCINTINPSGTFDGAEVLLYLFTLGFVCDELTKFWKAGRHIIGFWNSFNGVLYAFLAVSFVMRIWGLSRPELDDPTRIYWNKMSYTLLAFTAPMFWIRLLLYLDSIRFFGAMLVVVKVMMKESLIFFALLVVVAIGFVQAFVGMDIVDDNVADDVVFILKSMANSVLQSPDFSGFDNFSPPFGIILYYCFTFIVMVILLNVLIALYNSAYEDIYDNADDEYLALFAQKTMQFIRAPDENVFIAPFNLLEIVLVVLFEWWVPKRQYELINDAVMAVVYSPLLVLAAFAERKAAAEILSNRSRGEEDDDRIEEWEQLADEVDFETDGWDKTCTSVAANVEEDPSVVEVRQLRSEVEQLRGVVGGLIGVVGRRQSASESSRNGGEASVGPTAAQYDELKDMLSTLIVRLEDQTTSRETVDTEVAETVGHRQILDVLAVLVARLDEKDSATGEEEGGSQSAKDKKKGKKDKKKDKKKKDEDSDSD